MRIDKLIEGLNILAKYEPKGNVEPGLDTIYGPGPEEPSPEDKAKLDKLGWFWEEDSWVHFT